MNAQQSGNKKQLELGKPIAIYPVPGTVRLLKMCHVFAASEPRTRARVVPPPDAEVFSVEQALKQAASTQRQSPSIESNVFTYVHSPASIKYSAEAFKQQFLRHFNNGEIVGWKELC